MDLVVLLSNIERRLKALGISSDEASNRAGRRDAIRNLKRKIEAGTLKGSMRADTLAALARALETTQEDLTAVPQIPTPIAGLREYLLQQRALIDRQLAELEAAEKAANGNQKRAYKRRKSG